MTDICKDGSEILRAPLPDSPHPPKNWGPKNIKHLGHEYLTEATRYQNVAMSSLCRHPLMLTLFRDQAGYWALCCYG